jgi:signal transduction histidine kinase
VNQPVPGESAIELPWLAPSVGALVALARPDTPTRWSQVRHDPAALLLLARHHCLPSSGTIPRPDASAELLETACRFLIGPPCGALDGNHPAVAPVVRAARAVAAIARRLAEKTGACPPDAAWVGGLLAPLGWFAVGAVRPDALTACLHDAEWATKPEAVQARHWGYTHAEIARRLARRWQLPAWLTAVVGHLELPSAVARAFGADEPLFRVVQAAVGLAARNGVTLQLPVGATPAEALGGLGLPPAAVRGLEEEAPPPDLPVRSWSDPYSAPLLPELLAQAAENARRQGRAGPHELESEIDYLHRALRLQRADETERVRVGRLAGLAELAAGAGHEINNPLAVISGQAQHLLQHEADPGRQKSLQAIVRQAQRIHDILGDLMQFARPPRPQKLTVDVHELVREAAESVRELADLKKVTVELLEPAAALLDADPRQARTALAGLMRNAVEAAPAGGWARLRVESSESAVCFVIEDGGAGPAPEQLDHLFDPFFSGRPAGRGRGLGLPTAWRLAREQGGDVRFEPVPGGPTRFVLTLPRSTPAAPPFVPPERKSA